MTQKQKDYLEKEGHEHPGEKSEEDYTQKQSMSVNAITSPLICMLILELHMDYFIGEYIVFKQ